MTIQLMKAYSRERALGFQAKFALYNAKTRLAWVEREYDELDEPKAGQVRLQVLPDELSTFEDLAGDVYNPKVNDNIQLSRLQREEKQFMERVNRDGVYGLVGEYFDGEKWQHADSCWGFVGGDWRNSGTDTDIMDATLDAAKAIKTCPTCNRPILDT